MTARGVGEPGDAPVSKPLSAIVISYFTGPLLSRCVASLRVAEGVAEIILVDNGNPPGAVEEAAAAPPPATRVRRRRGARFSSLSIRTQ